MLARKDMCLFGHIPALVQNGIAALKIEGRMRTAEFIAPVVALYRKAVDRYFEDPAGYATNAAQMQQLFEQRVRELTTAHTFSNPGGQGVDISGKREPRFFSYASPEPQLTIGADASPRSVEKWPELIVHVSSVKAAEAALQAGADAIYFCGEGFTLHGGLVTPQELIEFAEGASACRIGVMMPHVCDQRDMMEWSQRLHQLAELPNVTIGVSNLGGLQLARESRFRDILADYTLNTVNSVAAEDANHTNLYMFAGVRYDIEIGLYYNRARYYNPFTGRFLQADPIGYEAGMNLYRYCRNNPMNYVDPSGNQEGLGIHPPTNYERVRDMLPGCRPASPPGKIASAANDISNNLLLCLFWQESSMGQNPDYMEGNSIGLGQMRQGACNDVDQKYHLDPGTCWREQQSGDLCLQISNTAAYLAIRHAFFPNETKSIRDALRGYGGNAPYDRYADPLLDCEKCMNECAEANPEGFVSNDKAQECFDGLNKQVKAAAPKKPQ